MRHLDANVAFWERAAAELRTPAQLKHVKFPKNLPHRFLQLAEATGRDGAAAVAQMPPLDELTRQLDLQLLEAATNRRPTDELNSEIASAMAPEPTTPHPLGGVTGAAAGSAGSNDEGLLGPTDELSKEFERQALGSMGEFASEFARQAAGGKPKQVRPSLQAQGLTAAAASAEGAAFLFKWGGLFARYTPPQRNFLTSDLGLRKV